MNSFVQKFSGKIKGIITGFDRIVFKGCLRPLMFPEGAMSFFRSRGVLNKNYKSWVMAQSKALVDIADMYARKICGQSIVPIPSSLERKEAIAHARQQATGIKDGLIGVWSSVEACSTLPSTTPSQDSLNCAINIHAASTSIFTMTTLTTVL